MIAGHVYVVGITGNPVKIGSARDVRLRLSSLQIGCPDELTLYHTEPVIHSMMVAEKAVHSELAEFHRRGEWFNVTVERAVETVRRIVPIIVAEESYRRRGSNSIVDRVKSVTALQPAAETAMNWYLTKLTATLPHDRKIIEYANDAIFRRAGLRGWTAFKLYMVEGKQPDIGLDARTARLIRLELGSAINHLTEWYLRDLPRLPGQSFSERVLGPESAISRRRREKMLGDAGEELIQSVA